MIYEKDDNQQLLADAVLTLARIVFLTDLLEGADRLSEILTLYLFEAVIDPIDPSVTERKLNFLSKEFEKCISYPDRNDLSFRQLFVKFRNLYIKLGEKVGVSNPYFIPVFDHQLKESADRISHYLEKYLKEADFPELFDSAEELYKFSVEQFKRRVFAILIQEIEFLGALQKRRKKFETDIILNRSTDLLSHNLTHFYGNAETDDLDPDETEDWDPDQTDELDQTDEVDQTDELDQTDEVDQTDF